ncbi:MAG: peptide chain release factor-like protein [Candidatus Omnitrophota bacterium]|nr:peptide chain release factor-like protein [Candidatus Omnitrophota bacterium]
MIPFPVSPKKQQELHVLMARLGVAEQDFEESFVRSSGPGGQNVNKVATCVVLRHRPSGLEVRCQRERSQALNRFLARRILLQRIEAERLGRLGAEAQRIAKIRRQKRRRSRRTREKLLRDRQHRAKKKSLRGPVSLE